MDKELLLRLSLLFSSIMIDLTEEEFKEFFNQRIQDIKKELKV